MNATEEALMDTEEEFEGPLSVGSGVQRGVNTDLTTEEGLQAAWEFVLAEYPERALFEHEIILNIAASDWQNGYEERTMKMLTREYGLMCATRIVAYLVATPGKARS